MTRGFMDDDHVQKSNLVDLEVKFIRQTDAAILIDDGFHEVWLPKSQINWLLTKSTSTGHYMTVTLPEWLAKEKELI